MKNFLLCTIVCLILCNPSVCAQTDEQMRQSEIEETLKQQCLHKVRALTMSFDRIASKMVEDSIKNYYINYALDLFIGSGDGIKDRDNNVVISAPKVEVRSLRRNNLSYPIKNYLKRLKSLSQDEVGEIIYADCYVIKYVSIKNDNDVSSIHSIQHYQVYPNKEVKALGSPQMDFFSPGGFFSVLIGDVVIQIK